MTARITVLGGIKGGAGKSTIATNFAVILASQNKDVLLIDADTQTSATDFTALRNSLRPEQGAGYTCIKLTDNHIRNQAPRLATKFDEILIDCGGRDTVSQRSALLIAHKIVMPFVPGNFDLWTINDCVKLIGDLKAVNPSLETYSFISRADATGSDNDDAAKMLSDEPLLNFHDTPIGNRKAFRNAVGKGGSVFELRPQDKKAVQEMETLFASVFGDSKQMEG